MPEFFSGWAEPSFFSNDAYRDWFWLGSEVQKFHSVSETVPKVYHNGYAGPRFDGRHNGGHAVVDEIGAAVSGVFTIEGSPTRP
ncbi:MAG TPA: hypothetical protein VGM65_05570 [Candidatus Udaeobacter sp.]